MDTDILYKVLIGGVFASVVLWMLRHNTIKIQELSNRVSVILEIIKYVKSDHDEIVKLADRQARLCDDVKAAHDKIRDINHNQQRRTS